MCCQCIFACVTNHEVREARELLSVWRPYCGLASTAGFDLVSEGPVADAKCHSWKVSVNLCRKYVKQCILRLDSSQVLIYFCQCPGEINDQPGNPYILQNHTYCTAQDLVFGPPFFSSCLLILLLNARKMATISCGTVCTAYMWGDF